MAEPIGETRRKAIEQCRQILRAGGRRSLSADIAYEYAMARLWHIETGRPLPPFSNGNYKVDSTQRMSSLGLRPARSRFRQRVIRSALGEPLIDEGNRRLREASVAAGKPEVCREEITSTGAFSDKGRALPPGCSDFL
jgi:hypothetical protein